MGSLSTSLQDDLAEHRAVELENPGHLGAVVVLGMGDIRLWTEGSILQGHLTH